MELSIETISPVVAAEMLDRNGIINRNVQVNRVATYAADMRAGAWLDTGDTIRVTDGGCVVDGQHRLLAVIKADVTLEMVVARGVAPDTIHVIDTGKPRTLADVLHIQGHKKAAVLAATISESLAYETYMADKFKIDGDPIANRGTVISDVSKAKRRHWQMSVTTASRTQYLNLLERRPSLEKSTRAVQTVCGVRSTSVINPPRGAIGLMHNISEHGYGGASVLEYVEAVRYGIGGMGSASNVLNSLLVRHHTRHSERLSPAILRSVWFRGYQSWVDDVPIKMVRKNTSLVYPVIVGDVDWYKAGVSDGL